jgi:mannitol-specific phosphotransferase system IIBC component
MMDKAQQHRIAAALQGAAPPPMGAALVKQSNQKQRHDRITSDQMSPHGKAPRRDMVSTNEQLDDRIARRTAKARAASVSVRTVSGGVGSSTIPEGRGSLRAEIWNAMER